MNIKEEQQQDVQISVAIVQTQPQPASLDSLPGSAEESFAPEDNSNQELDATARKKPLSPQSALEKLEEQKKRSLRRIEEFLKEHELNSHRGLSDVDKRQVDHERKINVRLRDLRKAVLGDVRLRSLNGERKLTSLVESKKDCLESLAEAALKMLRRVRDELATDKSLLKLRLSQEEFEEKYEEHLDNFRSRQLESGLNQELQDELDKLERWRSEMMRSHRAKVEIALQEMEQRKEKTCERLREFHLALSAEIDNFKTMEVEEIKLVAEQGLEFLNSAFNQCQSRLDLKKEESLSEHILPEIHESKNYLASKAIELMESLAEKLDIQSLDFSVEFMQSLDTTLESLAMLSEEVFEKNIAMQRRSKESAETFLSKLEEQLDERAKITHKLLSTKAKNTALEEISQQKINERLESLKSTYVSKVKSKITDQRIVDKNESGALIEKFEQESEKILQSMTTQLQACAKDIAERRRKTIKELERKILIVKDKSELLTETLTQDFGLD